MAERPWLSMGVFILGKDDSEVLNFRKVDFESSGIPSMGRVAFFMAHVV
jgi:hypothetical protein